MPCYACQITLVGNVGTEVPTEEKGVATGGVALKKQEVATSGVALPELQN